MKRCVAVSLAGLLLLGAAAPVLAETVLGKVGRTGVLTAGTRGVAIPFAFINEKNEWIGFAIDLLEAIRARLEKKLGKPIKLDKKEVGGDPAIRIRLVANRTIDVECAVTTYTRGRDQTVDFSIPFFFTGAQLLVKKGSGIKSLADVAGKRVGAAEGTTNEKALRASQPKAEVVTFQDHPLGFLALEQGRIVAYVSDGILLAGLAAKARNPKDYEVVGDFFSRDPYSCVVPENDSKWRDFVNHTLMELIDSGKYFELYDKWFGERGVVPYPMSDQVRNYMTMQSMPK
jgi:polar amino acid transport system substrate-binding protein/glutamate/aspartate transport system substrate-binding protein